MKRELMEVFIWAKDFKFEGDAHEHGDPADDRETANVLVDADVEPADRSVGAFYPRADVTEVLTEKGVDIRELLTAPALERLGDEYLAWKDGQRRSAYESYIDYRIKERKEEPV